MSQFAVNGKVPISVWCPSRDDAGNGTTTLNDLVGTNHGTLTNFALTGSTSNWVADTGAGGIRALDLDGVDDYIAFLSSALSFGSSASISMWIKLVLATPTIGTKTGFAQTRIPDVGRASHYPWTDGLVYSSIFRAGRVTITPSASVNRAGWHLLTITTNGTNYIVRQNETQIASTSAEASVNFSNANFAIGRSSDSSVSFYYLTGRIDDIRIFNLALDASDVSYLYNSGNGRGRLAGGRRRVNINGGADYYNGGADQ